MNKPSQIMLFNFSLKKTYNKFIKFTTNKTFNQITFSSQCGNWLKASIVQSE